MSERELNWGADRTDANYATGEDTSTGNFKVAEDTNGGTVLLEWDSAAGEWVSRGPVNLDGNDLTNVGWMGANEVSANKIDSDELFSDAGPTVFVRSDGNDSNDGLSAGNAKATISAAIDDAPILPWSSELVIDLQEATTFNEGDITNSETRAYRSIRLIGDGDGAGNNNTTIDGSGTGENQTIKAEFNGTMVLENLDIVAASSGAVYAKDGSVLVTACNINSRGELGVRVNQNGYAELDSNTTIDTGGSAGNRAPLSTIRGKISSQADITAGGGESQTVTVAEGASAVLSNCTIDAGNGSRCVRAAQDGSVEIVDASLQNATTGVEGERGSVLNVKSDVTYSGISTQIKRDSSCAIVEGDTDNNLGWNPTTIEDVSGTKNTATWYQNTTGDVMEVNAVVESDGTADAQANALLKMSPDQSDVTVDQDNAQASTSVVVRANVSATVPDGWYYQVYALKGSIGDWVEIKA